MGFENLQLHTLNVVESDAFHQAVMANSDRIAGPAPSPTRDLADQVGAHQLGAAAGRHDAHTVNVAFSLARPDAGPSTADSLLPHCYVCGSPDHVL